MRIYLKENGEEGAAPKEEAVQKKGRGALHSQKKPRKKKYSTPQKGSDPFAKF